MATSFALIEPLRAFFVGLSSKNEGQRLQAARDLSHYVATSVADMPSEVAKAYDQAINKRLHELTHSKIPEDESGGLAAIDLLLEIPLGEANDSQRLYRYFNYATAPLASSDVNVVVAASKVLGRIAEIEGASFGEPFVDSRVEAQIQVMTTQTDRGRYGAVLLLKELARHLPTWFAPHIALVFEKLPLGFRDARSNVREATGELLSACLEILTSKDREREQDINSKQMLVRKLMDDLKLLLQSPPINIHGTLVAYRNMLLHGAMFVRDHYQNYGLEVLKYKAHRDPLVRATVVSLIPTLAMYDVTLFTDHFMHASMAHLLSLLDKPSDLRGRAFVAIGHVAQAIGGEIKYLLEPVMQSVKLGLQQHGRRGNFIEEPIFQCIGMLATAVGPNLTKFMHDQIPLMFACGLSSALRQALVLIARFIPPLLKIIQERLLTLISQILSGQPYKPLGAPIPLGRPDPAIATQEFRTGASGPNTEEVILALNTLGAFDFSGHILNEFVRNCALPYIEDDLPEVRKAAALTCCRLFIKDPIVHQSSSHSLEIINEVLDKLLTVGIADPESEIRTTVLSNLDERLDEHLAQAENVRTLFMALNDEVFENRVEATKLIGRLVAHNPAYAMPLLRKAVLQLMTELEYSSNNRSREECVRILTLLISNTRRLIKPYALTILDTLLPKADDPNPAVAANVILALGELCVAGGEDVEPYTTRLMDIIIPILGDPSVIAKRDAALKTLGFLCSSTGYVIKPLLDYPQLLDLLGKLLKSTDHNATLKQEVMRLLGILGALDPYRRQAKPEEEAARDIATINRIPQQQKSQAAGDDYYQSVVIDNLLRVLKDYSLSTHHHHAIDAIMSIFKIQGLRSVAHLTQIFPAFTYVARHAPARQQDYYLQQLAILIEIVKEHVRNYVLDLLKMISELWDNPALQLPIVSVLESLGRALDVEFKPFLPQILPSLLKIFEGDLTEKRQQTQTKIFNALLMLGSNVEEYMHLIIPIITRTFERTEASTTLRKSAVLCIEGLSRRINFAEHASRVIHPLVRTLGNANFELRITIMETICSMVCQLGSDFAIFVPTISKAMSRHKISFPKYDIMIKRLLRGERVTYEPGSFDVTWNEESRGPEQILPTMVKLNVNQQHLKQAWDTSSVGGNDWGEWIHKLSVEFLKESPSHALRACMTLVEHYHPLARDLLNAAFLSCWTELYESYQEDLVRSITHVLNSADAPTDVINRMLDLVEFMEQKLMALPISHTVLGEVAFQNHAYAKALHHKEIDAFQETSAQEIEALISINSNLQQHDAAWGTLLMAQSEYDISEHEAWYERLGRWQEALVAYNKRQSEDPSCLDSFYGRMRCLHALGEWKQLSQDIDEHWVRTGLDGRRELAPMAAAAAWSLSEWDAMDDYISAMRADSPDRAFYKAILAIHKVQYPRALAQITRARDLLENETTSLNGDNYARSYTMMTRAQALSELEEIITYRQQADEPERQRTLRKTWMKRLQGCQPDVEVWQRILQVRTLVLNPEEDASMWIKFGNLCRKAGRFALAEKTFNSLVSASNQGNAPPEVVYAQLKLDWAESPSERCIEYLHMFATQVRRALDSSAHTRHPLRPVRDQRRLLSRCYYKLGEWQTQLHEDWHTTRRREVLQAYSRASQYDPDWYKAWHAWALANSEVVNQMDSPNSGSLSDINGAELSLHIISAIQGFFQSITLRSKQALQDTLRLLTLWFKYGDQDDISHAMSTGFTTVGIVTWLEVVPQIIARIQTPSANIFRNINFLLADIGRQHPQALIYPLTVAVQSPSRIRSSAALDIMNSMRQHSAPIVEQAKIVSEELLRVAILWNEMWREGLEEASRHYYIEHDNEAMLAKLEPLHAKIEAGGKTARELSFVQLYGRELLQAKECCRRYRTFGQIRDLEEAWAIYYQVFKKIERSLPQLITLDLHYVSPELEKLRDLQLAVPGTYIAGQQNVVTISQFAVKLSVIESKQRPRRLSLKGSDGRDYEYILKGHEDLRQDERVMQLFSLINDLLALDADSFKRRLHITRCPIVPLAPNAGLIGLIQGTDTLHALIRDYRNTHKILADLERRMMMQMSPDHENLTSIQKLEVFEHAVNHSTGQDVYRTLWEKAKNSEHWLERRSTYTSSLAVGSMVGHVLGLGDRHPSNILIDRESGKVIHIDFGDCFEVAMHREKYPERVPFRLTRMFRKAMEISGIRGSFTVTCQVTMKVLRNNRESLMAVLEALVYDPLISWRLQTDDTRNVRRTAEQGPIRRQADEAEIFREGTEEHVTRTEMRNERALRVFNRVKDKLTGRDFDPNVPLPVEEQVDRLIKQAQDNIALSQHFTGWCAFW